MLRNCDRCGKSVGHSKADNAYRHKNPSTQEWCGWPTPATKRQCPGCSGQYAVKKDGRLWAHANDMTELCTQEAPAPAEAQPGRPPTAAEVESWRAYDGGLAERMIAVASGAPVSDPAPTVDVVDDTKPYASAPCGIQECCGDDVNDSSKGPWFSAMYSGECSAGYCVIEEGDWIRADGQGGYECENCGEDGIEMMPADWQQQASAAARRHLTAQEEDTPYVALLKGELRKEGFVDTPERGPLAGPTYVDELRIPANRGPMPTPEEFMDPSSVDDPADKLNVSGQPNARYEWYGSQNRGYLVKEPHTGDFRRYKNGKPKGLTRATTFNKAASDSKAINDWGKRNIVIGASRRPNILLRAHGLTHENDRRELEGIVAELEEAAGAKVGSELGTYLHEFTEQMDAGLKTPDQAPEEFQSSLWRYRCALVDAGLEPVPGLIERTTMITEYGGVVGTFDRIFYHRPSGTYIVGDLKTGKTMEYAMNETETQMWVYAHGVNQNGVYDWNTDTWDDVLGKQCLTVSEHVGVIIHMPVQGPLAGQVVLDHADLQAGARHAELCHRNRTAPKSKVRPFEPPLPARPLTWEERFALVTSGEHATRLWREAKAAGIAGVRLNELVSVARQALADKG